MTGPSREWAGDVALRLLSMIIVFGLSTAAVAGRPTRDVTARFEVVVAAAVARRVGILDSS